MPELLPRKLKSLLECRSGNATLLMALGMPVLIGGAGLGVDMAQWYMWKQELQYAVDQAAVAGAWARAETETESTYVTRATQEFNANLDVTGDFAATPEVRLADFAGGTFNSVAVTATATRNLPFSSFLTGRAATIWAYAQASFEEGVTFTSCLIAVDDDDTGSITIGGSAVMTASCGMAALSNDEEAISVDGQPTVDAGWIIARGGIDDWLKQNTDDIILEYEDGLYDPFEELVPPEPAESLVERNYTCSEASETTTADVSTTVETTYSYYEGPSVNNLNPTPIPYDNAKPSSTVTNSTSGMLVSNDTENGTYVSESTSYRLVKKIAGQLNVYERVDTKTTKVITNLIRAGGNVQGDTVPGTYSSIRVACNTTFAPGVYIIDGGGVDISGQYEVTGSNIMFVLKNGAYIKIRGGADINLTAIQASDLIARGIDPEQANQLAGMLVFEDRNSPGTLMNDINGNTNTILNGTIYTPVSPMFFAGTANVTSRCLMIAANNIILTGTTDMKTFCPAGSEEDTTVIDTAAKVRLVA
jgi:Flp pilus assembly protein TadG